jgi:hypothetical protein
MCNERPSGRRFHRLALLACIALFCLFAVYVAQAAFAPVVAAGRWELLFIAIAGLGFALAVCRRIFELVAKPKTNAAGRARARRRRTG